MVATLIARCVRQKKTLMATYTYDALALADAVVVDVQCDYNKECLGDCRQGSADIAAALEESLQIIGQRIRPDCLVLIETTVPPGTTEYVAYPIVKKAFEERGLRDEPLLAHSFERVMPGRDYVAPSGTSGGSAAASMTRPKTSGEIPLGGSECREISR